MEGTSPRTLKRILIAACVALVALILIIAGVYAIAFIILAPMMT
ncbi:hypothetical protein [Mycolicibacterium sp. XJ870]